MLRSSKARWIAWRKWIANPPPVATTEAPKVEAMLAKIEMANKPKVA